AKLPGDVDALLVVLGGADAVNFLTQYEQAGGNKPMVGGSITVDQTVLNFKGKRRDSLLGTPSAGPIADSYDAPEWKKFVADYKFISAVPNGNQRLGMSKADFDKAGLGSRDVPNCP